MEQLKKNRGPLIAAAVLIVIVLACVGIWMGTRPPAVEGAKALTIQVVHGDGSAKNFDIHTDAENLGDALLEHKELAVVGSNGEYGLYITSVDGEEASDADQTYWSISQEGEMLTVGVDSQPIADGERYELTLSKW
mgnify:CR=1 FL=1